MSESAAGAFADDACVHQAFHVNAGRSPESVAVIDGDRHVTYRALQRHSLALARTLAAAGVGPDVPVPLLADRSAEAAAAVFGILTAGGAYVPIAAHEPDQRIARIVENCRAGLIVVQPHLRHRVPSSLRVVEVGAIDGSALASEEPPPDVAVDPGHLAAIVYTSGTTGTPKGVEVPHRSIMARARRGYVPRRGDLQKASIGVAAHFSDFLMPLVCGGSVLLVPDDAVRNISGLLEYARRHGTTRMVFVPSQLATLLEAPPKTLEPLAALDTVIVSGETLSPALVETFKRLFPHVSLVNAYGASETVGLACMAEIASSTDIHVGHAQPGYHVAVLNDEQEPVAPGETGEVCVGGPPLARGYCNDAGLTAERFIQDPSAPGRTIYRTGDLGTQTADGRLRILGRRDAETKVRGFRVNLNAVESVLERCPGVERAVVVADAQSIGSPLAGFVVAARSSEAANAAWLRRWLAEQLPPYMIPSRITYLTTFPLLPNGKVDRLALARLATEAASTSADDFVAPSTTTEQWMAAMWQEILGVEQVGATDDFFVLGGDSLAAMRFISRAEEAGLTVTFGQLAEETLSTLARRIDRDRAIG